MIALATTFSFFLFIPLLFVVMFWIWKRSYITLAALIAGLSLLIVSHPIFPQKALLPQSTAGNKLHTMTFNAGWKHTPAEQLADTLGKQRAEIIAIQEATPSQIDLYQFQLQSQYPHQVFDPDGWGIGLLSQHPITNINWLKPPTNGRTILHAQIEVENQPLDIFVVHFSLPTISMHPILGIPYGVDEYWQAKEINFVLNTAKSIDGPVLIMGDFNMSDQSHTYKELSSAFGDAFRDGGWGLGFTFPSQVSYYHDRLNRNILLPKPLVRIDYIFYSKTVAIQQAKVTCFTDRSDHCALQARFAWP